MMCVFFSMILIIKSYWSYKLSFKNAQSAHSQIKLRNYYKIFLFARKLVYKYA